jgi:hypothetical protein
MSTYSSDPEVPAAHIGHLGRHHANASHAPSATPASRASAARPTTRSAPPQQTDDGPTYADFLEEDADETAGGA